MLSGCSEHEAHRRRADLQAAIDRTELDGSGGTLVRLSASVGVAMYPADGDSYETLLAAADRRMYQDKTHQKHRAAGHSDSRRQVVHGRGAEGFGVRRALTIRPGFAPNPPRPLRGDPKSPTPRPRGAHVRARDMLDAPDEYNVVFAGRVTASRRLVRAPDRSSLGRRPPRPTRTSAAPVAPSTSPRPSDSHDSQA